MNKFGRAAFGVFRQEAEVNSAKAELGASGFGDEKIEVLYPRHKGLQDFDQRYRTMVQIGVPIGAAIGGFVFASIAMLVNWGFIAAPGFQAPDSSFNKSLLVAGLFAMGMLLGAAFGALIGIGVPRRAGDRFAAYVDSGGILLSVHVDGADESRRAQAALEKSGGQDITLLNERSAWLTVDRRVRELYSELH